jgi:hypothetical protein
MKPRSVRLFAEPVGGCDVPLGHPTQSISLCANAPNPSIERTSNSRLRRLSAAPHVKR